MADANTAKSEEQLDANSWKLKAVRDNMNDLRALWQRKVDANESFNEACAGVAEQANISKQALAAYVNAVMRNKEEEHRTRAQQLDILFEEI